MRTISTALLKEQLKRCWVLIPLSLLGYLLFVIFPIYFHAGGRDGLLSARVMIEVLAMRRPFMLAAAVLIPLGTVMALFSYLFDPRAAAGFYGLSETRNQLFWTNVLSGLILMLVPLLVTSLLLLIRVRFPMYEVLAYPTDLFTRGLDANSVINTFPVILGFFARTAVSFLFFFALFLLTVTLSGSGKIAVLLSVILPILPIVFYRLGRMILSMYVFGYDAADAPLTEDILSYANPLAWFGESVINAVAYVFNIADFYILSPEPILSFTNPLTWYWNWGAESQAVYFLAYTGITAIALGIAAACFSARKAEQAGEGIVFRPFKHIIVFLLSLTGMMAMGAFLLSLLTGRAFMYYGFVLGFVITFCIGHMIFGGTFKIRHTVKWITPAVGAAAVLYGIMLLLTASGAGFYTNHVPRPSAVSGVHIGTERWVQGGDFINDEELIHQVISIHEDIVEYRRYLTNQQIRDMSANERRDLRSDRRDHRRAMRNAQWQSLSGGGIRFAEQGGRHIYIAYRLTNNDIEYRRYALTGTFIRQSGLAALLDPEAYALPFAPVFDNPSMAEAIEIVFDGGEGFAFSFTVSEQSEISALLGSLQLDSDAQAAAQQDDESEADYLLIANVQISEAYSDTYRRPVIRLTYIENTMALFMQYEE